MQACRSAGPVRLGHLHTRQLLHDAGPAAAEPQVFTAMAGLVTTAHFANTPVLVRYEPAVPTDYAIEVQSPPGKAKAAKIKSVVELAGMLHKKGRKLVLVKQLSR